MDSALHLADKIVVVLHDQINVLSKISISMKDVKNVQKIEIIEHFVPPTKISGETYGSFKNGEIIEVPNHIAVFLLCKGVAKTL